MEEQSAPNRGAGAGRTLLVAWAHLAVLWSFAFAQPLLDLLGDSPEFFVARGNTRGDILLLAFTLVLVPPTVLALVEAAFMRVPRVREALHLAFVAVLVAALALQVVTDVLDGLPAYAAIALAAALGAGAAALYARREGLRTFLTVLSPAPAVFLALFLLVSPVSDLVLPQDDVRAAGVGGGTDAPVVMVVFDEFSGGSLLDRRLRIDASRYPNFAELARRSTWYRNATTVDYQTQRAVPALLTGTRPRGDALPIAADHPRNLFTLLGERYALDVRETATELCPESLCGERETKAGKDRLRALADDLSVVSLRLLLPDELAEDLPAVDATFEGFRDTGGDASEQKGTEIPARAFADRPGQWERFLGRLGPTEGRPPLHFLHIPMPHWPWQYLPSGQQYPTENSRIPGVEGPNWQSDRRLVEQGYQRYLLQLGYVDRMIGRLIARLEDQGIWDDALVVVAADHGVSFRANTPRRYVTDQNFPDIASVPLFVKAPGQERGRVDDSAAQTIDVLPTIADLLRLQTGWRFDGRSLREGAGARASVAVVSGEEYRKPFATFRRMRDAEVARRTALFGAGDGGAGLFAPGSGAALVGRRPADLPAAPGGSARAEIEDLPLLADVDPDAALLPALATGRITGEMKPGTDLAFALNGRIWAVAPTYSGDGELRFSALLPPAAFRAGRNRLELYAIGEGRPGVSALAPVRGASTRRAAGRLAGGAGDLRIELAGGRPVAVARGAVAGFVEHLRVPDAGHVEIEGWAADARRRASVSRILVFVDGQLIGETKPDAPRPDVAKTYGPRAALSGYRLSIARLDAASLARRVRVFAVSGGRASELPRLAGAGE